MTSILDHFLQQNTQFCPGTMDDLFALRLAQLLDDSEMAGHYVRLVSEHSMEGCLVAYRRALKNSNAAPIAARFHNELQDGHGRWTSPEAVMLIAMKVERRSIAAAVYRGRHLEDTDLRHLASSSPQAESSAIGFINRMLFHHEPSSAALEFSPDCENTRRLMLSKAVLENCILNRNLSVWSVSKRDLFRGFGVPALESRKELRQVILSIWPTLQDEPASEQLLDAVAVGALVQTERLFLP